jgi:Cd2+/Zn2+-exporting ATPase
MRTMGTAQLPTQIIKMKLPFQDKKFLFLLSAISIVVALEVLSLIGIHIPMPYAPFVFAAFILGIGSTVLWDGVKAIFKLKFSSINLLMTINFSFCCFKHID